MQGLEGLLDPLGDLERAGAGELLDHQHHARAPGDDGVADQRLVVHLDVRDVGQAQPTTGALDGNLAQLRRVGDLLQQVPHLEALLRRLDEPTGAGCRRLEEGQRGDDLGVAGGSNDLAQCHASLTQPLGVDLHLQLLVAHAPDGDVGDSRDAHQARPQRSTGR